MTTPENPTPADQQGSVSLGRNELPPPQQEALRRAKRLAWTTIAFLVTAVTAIYLTMGNSQAMKAAWAEDLLSFIPPITFLVAIHVSRKPPSPRHPYGFHRSVGIGHLIAATSLFVMGAFLLFDSASGLISGEHPPVGLAVVLGHEIWAGWLMIAALAYTAVPPVLLGRAKLPLAEELHDRVLFADADMNKADWMTAVGGIVGILGIGLGVWWADYAAAIFISGGILRDGISNLRIAVTALMDSRALTVDGTEPHPLDSRVGERLRELAWVDDAAARVRDLGHVFHAECFVIAVGGGVPTMDQLVEAREAVAELDWTLEDVVVVPVTGLPEEVLEGTADDTARRDQGADGGAEPA